MFMSNKNDFKLTMKQKAFADEYIINGGNATQAYKKAGYTWSNEQVAEAGASRTLSNVKVRRYIHEKVNSVEKQTTRKQINAIEEIDRLIEEAISVDQLGYTTIEDYEADIHETGATERSTTKRIQKPRINEIAKLFELKLKYEQMKNMQGSGVSINISLDGMSDYEDD
jgi:phage terminase small subunit